MSERRNPLRDKVIMNWNKIRLDPADTYFSKYIRLKKKQCEKCGRRGEGSLGIDGLQASHFHTRRKESVRFDEENVDVLCAGCHKYFTDEREHYREWKRVKLGIRGYDILEIRANTVGKKDRKLQRMIWKKLLKDEFGI